MIFSLTGLDSTERYITGRVNDLLGRVRINLARHVEDLATQIAGLLPSEMAGTLEITHEGNSITLSLPYIIGTDSKGRPKRTVRKAHNPYWSEFKVQPFQKVLEDNGYLDIHPVGALEPSKGSAPNIRIKATMGPEVIRMLTR